MKTKYCCETCGKEFDNEKAAVECEKKHMDAKQEQELKKKHQDNCIALVNKALVNVMAGVNELRKNNPDTYIDIDYVGGTAKVVVPDNPKFSWDSIFFDLFR